MIIKNPKENVVGFDLFEWLVESESSPKKDVRNFLCSRYEEISGKRVQPAQNEEEQDEVKDDDDSDLQSALLNVAYEHFSLTEGGDIVLEADDNDTVDLLLTDADAKELLPKLKSKLEDRVAKLGKLLK